MVISKAKSAKTSFTTAKNGSFSATLLPGRYQLHVSHPAFRPYDDSFSVSSDNVDMGIIRLVPDIHMLDEVNIVEKVIAMVQKDDTIEFNSSAYKVNPDADGVDLIRKMQSIEVNNKQITSQGEQVIKILVDGKPFFGDDPYNSLKNFPAEMIGKVQVYNEKSDQEQFTGFSEGNTTKTINIITKPEMRRGAFGKLFGGYGLDAPPGLPSGAARQEGKYGAGASVNNFGGDRRVTLSAQSANTNVATITADNPAAKGDGGGLATTHTAGINYTDKWGKKVEVSGSYNFNNSNSSTTGDLRKTYISAFDSGQVYNAHSPSTRGATGHRYNMRLVCTADSLNSLIWSPQFSLNKSDGNSSRVGNTVENGLPVNNTSNNNQSLNSSLNWSQTLLLRHKFRTKGRTFSLSIATGSNSSDGSTINTAQNVYYSSPSLSDTFNRRIVQQQDNRNISADANYTEPIAKNGSLKLQYTYARLPASSVRDAYDYLDAQSTYSTIRDTLFSNSFRSGNTAHKAGASYLFHKNSIEFSVGLNGQWTQVSNRQEFPLPYDLSHSFQTLLPAITFHYKITKTKNLQCTYNTASQPPSLTQLQNVVNNNDPLHLYLGNPALKQPYSHNLTIRYGAAGKNSGNSFSASLNARYSLHSITSSSFIAPSDTLVQGVALAKGSQLTMPQNVDGASAITANSSYGLPVKIIKCRLNGNINVGVSRNPAIINGHINFQEARTAGLGFSLSSNINANTDFLITSNTNISSTINPLNGSLNTSYLNEYATASLNLILWKGIVYNTSLSYQSNSGLSAGFSKNYLLCNMSIGKKVFKKHQGDIRLSVFDMLNENNNIQRTITETYILDARSNILQRYFLIVFTWKINSYRK